MERYLRVTAPFDGVVTERDMYPDALVDPDSVAAAAMPMVRARGVLHAVALLSAAQLSELAEALADGAT
jgi:multidrug resistance efflux pump